MDEKERYKKGMKVRREVLGDDYVDRSIAKRNEFNTEFQEFITRNAWGEMWTRPGLTRRERSLLTLGLMVALKHEQEFRIHLRGAFNNGATREDVREVLMHCAVYCGVPAANAAFHLAQEVFGQMDEVVK